MGGNCSIGFFAAAAKREGSTTADNSTYLGSHTHTQGSNNYTDILSRHDDSDSYITRSGSSLVCTNNQTSVNIEFIVKYFNLIALDGSNNLA